VTKCGRWKHGQLQ
jgi:hypothetical protein